MKIPCDRWNLLFFDGIPLDSAAPPMDSAGVIGRGESGWCSDVTSTHGAWRHAGVRFLLPGEWLKESLFLVAFPTVSQGLKFEHFPSSGADFNCHGLVFRGLQSLSDRGPKSRAVASSGRGQVLFRAHSHLMARSLEEQAEAWGRICGFKKRAAGSVASKT